ncbi:sulfatase [Rubritalea halochordaticola]
MKLITILFSLPTMAAVISLILGSATAEPKKPNFLIILADDLGSGDLSCTGSTQINTPHIDSIAAGGALCTQGYTAAPVCAPSRCGLMTGKSPAMIGNDMNLGPNLDGMDPEFHGLNVKEKTMADRLKALGYTTAVVGKWHLGEKEQFQPAQRGFDIFHGFLSGGRDYFAQNKGNGGAREIQSTLGEVPEVTYLTDDLTDAGIKIIEQCKDEPFFLFMSYNAPHTPMQATKEDLALYEYVENKKRRTYCAMVHGLDRGVGRLLESLKVNGVDQNTLVVFMSDNGGASSNSSCNAPLRAAKGTLLEGGVRTPFLVSWPGVITPGTIIESPVSALDWMPTFIHAAGGSVSEKDGLDGLDLVGVLSGKVKEPAPRDLYWRFHGVNMMRSGDLKIIDRANALPWVFDLSKDPGEQNDLFKARLEEADSLKRKLGDWVLEVPHPLYWEGDNWAKIQAKAYEKSEAAKQPADHAPSAHQ